MNGRKHIFKAIRGRRAILSPFFVYSASVFFFFFLLVLVSEPPGKETQFMTIFFLHPPEILI